MINSKKITRTALLITIAVLLGYVENLFPPVVPVPGIKLGLANAVIMVATAPKSNSAHVALDMAMADIRAGITGDIPRQLQNVHAETTGLETGQNYKYPHDYKGAFVIQQYLPDKIKNKKYYIPKDIGYEKQIKEIYERLAKLKNNQNKK